MCVVERAASRDVACVERHGVVAGGEHGGAHASSDIRPYDPGAVTRRRLGSEQAPPPLCQPCIRSSGERAPVWLNLEYLSGEDWVADFHLRSSPHPRYPLIKTFFFPGLGAGTGGVLKERTLDAARAAFENSSDTRAAWWHRATGTPPPDADATVVSLFAYENPAVDSLLEQFEFGHGNGASADHSRIIRLSYHRPDYVRLAKRAYETWAQVEAESGERIVTVTGGLIGS